MIKQPTEIAKANKKIRILIAGYPGIGKSTVALSAPAPLHIDVDRGLDRVRAQYRKPYIQPESYDELLGDLKPEPLRDFETLVFDTGGQLIKLMGNWAVKKNSAYGQKDGSLALKGYGAVGREFERLMNHCYYVLNKHVVIVFHAKEEKDGDNVRLRLLVEGQTKDNVWQPMDLGGFIEMNNNRRAIGFENCERYYAKSTHGIGGVLPIPDLKDNVPNDFLTKLFVQVDENIKRDALLIEEEKERCSEIVASAKEIIDAIDTPEAANDAVLALGKLEEALTSKTEARALFLAKIAQMGYKKEKGQYVCAS